MEGQRLAGFGREVVGRKVDARGFGRGRRRGVEGRIGLAGEGSRGRWEGVGRLSAVVEG